MDALTADDWRVITVALHTLRVQVMAQMEETPASRAQTEEELQAIAQVLAKIATPRRGE